MLFGQNIPNKPKNIYPKMSNDALFPYLLHSLSSEETLCAPVAVRPCLSCPRTQRRIQSLRNKCGGGRVSSIQQQQLIWKKKEEIRRSGQIHADSGEPGCYSSKRSSLCVCLWEVKT